MTVLLFKTERNGMERNENGTIEKKERERNILAEGPRSRTEQNDLKKVGTCPALGQAKAVIESMKERKKAKVRVQSISPLCSLHPYPTFRM